MRSQRAASLAEMPPVATESRPETGLWAARPAMRSQRAASLAKMPPVATGSRPETGLWPAGTEWLPVGFEYWNCPAARRPELRELRPEAALQIHGSSYQLPPKWGSVWAPLQHA